MESDNLILVNENDEAVGYMDKMQVHKLGLLHRAFSIFIFDSKGRLLLQKRAERKYHGGGLWTNTCCSHPKNGDNLQTAAERRLFEEMGFTTNLQKIFEFTYLANVENGLIENEYDHVFTGIYEGIIDPDRNEVADYTYKDIPSVSFDIESEPHNYTSWFKIAFPKIRDWSSGRNFKLNY